MNDGKTPDENGYRVLARKYRPRDFGDLIGQEPMVRTLTNAFETERIAQAYMLTGVRGVGKTTTARILARALNYRTDSVDKPTIDLATPGEHCEAIMAGSHVDVIEMDAASHTGIDDIREIIEQVRYRPVTARYKVYIIDEVHMLSTQAFNGLLKTLEEPPAHVKFIFATTEIRKVPVTVLSRCQRFDLRRIEAAALIAHFRAIAEKEGVAIDDESLAMIARAAEGSARDGLSLMDQAIAHGGGTVESAAVRDMLGVADRSQVVELFHQVAKGDVTAALATFRALYDGGANPTVILTDLADFTHLVTRLKFVADAAADPALSEAERTRGNEFADELSVPVLSRLWQMLLKGIPETEQSSRPVSACEMVLIRLTHAANLPSPGEAVKQFTEALSREPSPPADRPSNGGRPASDDAPQSASAAFDNGGPPPGPSGSGPVAMLRPVEDGMPQAQETARPQPIVATIADLAELAGDNRDAKLKAMIRKYLRPVKIEAGRLEVGLAEDAPKSLIGELDGKLKQWTGMRWIIAISRERGGHTIEEMEKAHRAELVSDAGNDPDVAAILNQFPGARITDVRIRAEDMEPPASQQSEDGDILPDDTDS
ncbi:DNA polymerase III subunit gamma/tau [Nitratireductor sp. XY-223]|uniref:DNA polymerase III subunit gamma/tau n=1 Tax=Nitratireductor sp. XY-223 TaxID=2561926 RepID=UPI0010AAE610|nr:DNA polymerase III subunit gamma/tau [Nitratireductor sp. XY-223]